VTVEFFIKHITNDIGCLHMFYVFLFEENGSPAVLKHQFNS